MKINGTDLRRQKRGVRLDRYRIKTLHTLDILSSTMSEPLNTQIAKIAQAEANVGTRLERSGTQILQRFPVQQIAALRAAVNLGQDLQQLVADGRPLVDYPAISPLLALQTILDQIQQVRDIPEDLPNQDYRQILGVWFSADGQRYAMLQVHQKGESIAVWDLQGNLLQRYPINPKEPPVAVYLASPEHPSDLGERDLVAVQCAVGLCINQLGGNQLGGNRVATIKEEQFTVQPELKEPENIIEAIESRAAHRRQLTERIAFNQEQGEIIVGGLQVLRRWNLAG